MCERERGRGVKVKTQNLEQVGEDDWKKRYRDSDEESDRKSEVEG